VAASDIKNPVPVRFIYLFIASKPTLAWARCIPRPGADDEPKFGQQLGRDGCESKHFEVFVTAQAAATINNVR